MASNYVAFKQPYELVEALGSKVEGVMQRAVNVAEDMQEDGEQYVSQIDKIEQYLMEFAKLSEDVKLRKQALDEVLRTETKEDEEPPDLSNVFLKCLDKLQASRKTSYDPRNHPIVQQFSERVRENDEESESSGEEESGDEEGDLVVGQVDKSLKCPITKVYFEEPVTSKVCKHSYSKAAIIAHIRQCVRPRIPKCPVCAKAITESDLVADKKLAKSVRKAKRQKSPSHTRTGVVKL